MGLLKQYSVEIASLELGEHQFNFQIKKAFFDELDYSELEDGDLDITLDIEKKERMILFNFDIKGTVRVMCDRCTDIFDIPVISQHQLILKYGSRPGVEDDDDVVVIRESQNEFNIAANVYEFIILALPYKRVHPDDENGVSLCNKEFMKTFASYQPATSVEDRWEKLKKLNRN